MPGAEPPAGEGRERSHQRALEALARRGRLRKLTQPAGIDFSSNDYLGLAASPELSTAAREALERGVPLGAGGSRLLRGNHEEHEALEADAAQFFGSEAALYFGSGFAANAAVIATLPARGDLIVYDELIHASAWDGMVQSKADTKAARHNDVGAFEKVIRAWRSGGGIGRVWIAVESLYSMDGDFAPLADLAALAARFDAMLLIDEAHATGVLGPGGRGLAAALDLEGRENVVALHTCGKALGASGALITSSAAVRAFLINRARAFIYATAPSPVIAAVVRRALAIVRDEPERRVKLAGRVAFANETLQRLTGKRPSGSHILPVVVGQDLRAVALAGAMQARGYDVRAIRPPTVPEGTARLRIAITLNTDEAVIGAMLADLAEKLGNSKRGETRGAGPQSMQGADSEGLAQPRYVITGTGTGVGKTVIAAALTSALGGDYWKPVQAGLDGPTDTDTVRALTGLPDDRFHAEAYRLVAPAAPLHAATDEGITIDPDRLEPPATSRPLVIEGAGGLMVPLTPKFFMIDLFERWNLPVILVASTALGTINHTLLSIEALKARGVPLLGIAFVGERNEDVESFICIRTGASWLGRLPRFATLDRETLRQAFDDGFRHDLIPGLAGRISAKFESWRAPP